MKKRAMYIALCLVLSLLLTSPAWGAPIADQVLFQRSWGMPDGTYTFKFTLWTTEAHGSGASSGWMETKNVTTAGYIIKTYLGNTASIGTVDFSLYCYVQTERKKLDGTFVLVGAKRIRLNTAPYAMWSDHAEHATNADNADTVDGKHAADFSPSTQRIPISSLPYTISAPGSYYLTGNLSSAGHGIVVNADNVTIDLNGFTLTGPGIMSIYSGILITGRGNVEIKNGTVTNFSGGIRESSSSLGNNHRVNNVRAVGNNYGMYLSGQTHYVNNCDANNNYSNGIAVEEYCIVRGNRAIGNSGIGIVVGRGCLISGNVAVSNSNYGIYLETGYIMANSNMAWSNGTGMYISTGYYFNVVGNVVGGNTTANITNNCTGGCTVVNNTTF